MAQGGGKFDGAGAPAGGGLVSAASSVLTSGPLTRRRVGGVDWDAAWASLLLHARPSLRWRAAWWPCPEAWLLTNATARLSEKPLSHD
jgi:hypothetical protein